MSKKRRTSSKKFVMTRRGFLQTMGAAGAVYWLGPKLMIGRNAYAQIPGGTLDPGAVSKYMTPMLIPPVMPKAGTITQRGGKNVDYYEISMRQFAQQILPAGLPATTVWGYGAVASASNRGLLLHNAPSLTIEAKWNAPVRIKWINELVDANGNFLPHLLPVDQTLHWANPPAFHKHTRCLHRPGADGDARARRSGCGRRERRVCRGLVLARSGH